MVGYCKYCRRHGVQVSQFDKHPDGSLIRNKKFEVRGICLDCEMEIRSTKAELIEALNYIGRHSIHMFSILQEVVAILPDAGSFNLDEIYDYIQAERKRILTEGHYLVPADDRTETHRMYDTLKRRIGYVVVAAARMQQESTPPTRKQAARSIFARGKIAMQVATQQSVSWREIESEFGRWAHDV